MFCSGSIISSKHILTSAECLLKDKNNINKEVTTQDYIQPDKIYIQMGDSERRPIDSKKIISKVHTNGQGFVDGYNFNIGKHFQFTCRLKLSM